MKSADEALITGMSGLKVTPGAPLRIQPSTSSPQHRLRSRLGVGRKPLVGPGLGWKEILPTLGACAAKLRGDPV